MAARRHIGFSLLLAFEPYSMDRCVKRLFCVILRWRINFCGCFDISESLSNKIPDGFNGHDESLIPDIYGIGKKSEYSVVRWVCMT